MALIPIHTIIMLVLIIGTFVLQFYLSKRESKWPGRIIPIICFLFSLIVPLNFTAPEEGVTFGTIVQIVLVTCLANIPTAIHLVIYSAVREKFKRRRQMDKMNIQDLD